MRQLPGLLLTNQTANATAQIVLKELDARIERVKTALLTGRYGDNSGAWAPYYLTSRSRLKMSNDRFGWRQQPQLHLLDVWSPQKPST